MVEQICPRCDSGNPLDSQFCGQCGARLGSDVIVPQAPSDLTVGRGPLLPARSVRQIAGAVAVSLLALAAEAGLRWLRRRLEEPIHIGSRPRAGEDTPVMRPEKSEVAGRATTTLISRRVVRIWRQGRLAGEGVEHAWWQIKE